MFKKIIFIFISTFFISPAFSCENSQEKRLVKLGGFVNLSVGTAFSAKSNQPGIFLDGSGGIIWRSPIGGLRIGPIAIYRYVENKSKVRKYYGSGAFIGYQFGNLNGLTIYGDYGLLHMSNKIFDYDNNVNRYLANIIKLGVDFPVGSKHIRLGGHVSGLIFNKNQNSLNLGIIAGIRF